MMEHTDTIQLLRECDAGSKMAVLAIDEVLEKVKDPQMEILLLKSKQHHTALGNEMHALLLQQSSDEKEPAAMAKWMAWMKTNWKMEMDESDATAANLIIDGCNMGIKSLNKYLNQYEAADEKAKNICTKLIGIEEELTDDLKKYL